MVLVPPDVIGDVGKGGYLRLDSSLLAAASSAMTCRRDPALRNHEAGTSALIGSSRVRRSMSALASPETRRTIWLASSSVPTPIVTAVSGMSTVPCQYAAACVI